MDGTIDLGDGIWVGMRATGRGIAQGLKAGEVLPLLPSAKETMAASKGTDDPVNWCLPLGWMYDPAHIRSGSSRITRRRSQSHMYILSKWHEARFRQIFQDGRKHPAEPEPTWFGHSIGRNRAKPWSSTPSDSVTKFWFDRLVSATLAH